jgi:Peptidase family S41
VKSVRSHTEGDDVGYIRITQFNEQTTEGLKKAISDLTSQLGSDKIKGFVIDLRNNPGGLLDQAISVSDAFLDKGEIVSTRGRNAEETQRFNAHAGDLTKGKPLIVLINGGSASASEIVAIGNQRLVSQGTPLPVAAQLRCKASARRKTLLAAVRAKTRRQPSGIQLAELAKKDRPRQAPLRPRSLRRAKRAPRKGASAPA